MVEAGVLFVFCFTIPISIFSLFFAHTKAWMMGSSRRHIYVVYAAQQNWRSDEGADGLEDQWAFGTIVKMTRLFGRQYHSR